MNPVIKETLKKFLNNHNKKKIIIQVYDKIFKFCHK